MNTWADIRSTFRSMVNDDNALFFTASQATAWANKALRDMAGETEYRDGVGTVAVTAGSYGASVGTALSMWRMEWDNEVLLPTTYDALARKYRNWAEYTGEPRLYYLDHQRGSETLVAGLYPIPAANGTARYYTKAVPTAVSDASPSTEIDLPDWSVGGVLYYMLSQAYRSDSKRRNIKLAAYWEAMYLGVRDRLKGRSYSRMVFRAPSSTPLRMGMDVWRRAPEYVTGTV